MKTINKIARKLGLRKPKYRTLMVRSADYWSFKVLAAAQKKTHVDFLPELLTVYLECKRRKHEAVIADLLFKQGVLVDELKLYRERVGILHRPPADTIPKPPRSGDAQ